MEDEKIIDLYFERNESAVTETALKYGRMLCAIAYSTLKKSSGQRGMRKRYLPCCVGTRYRRNGDGIFPHFWDVSCEMSRLANMTIIMPPSVIRILR